METLLEKLETLSLAERIQLVEDIWDGIARSRKELPIPQWQEDALECRKRHYHLYPDFNASWDCVKQKILQKQK